MLVLVLVVSLCAPAFAAESDALLTLSARTRVTEDVNQVVVKVNATKANVIADGKLAMDYDSSALRFAGISTGTAWGGNTIALQANDKQEGKLVFAFAANTAAKTGVTFNVTFDVVKPGFTDLSIAEEDSYITGAEGESLSAEVTVEAGGHVWSEWTILREPTCFENGSKTRTCKTCGKVDVRPIPANSDNCPSAGYKDVDLDSYYHEGVDYVVSRGIMIGRSATTFDPTASISRGDLMLVLYRLAGSPACGTATPFRDVHAGDYYAKAISWAHSNGIANGTSNTTFSPDAPTTREQMVAFLFRYTELVAGEQKISGDLSRYTDNAKVSDYAVEPLTWATENGIINGYPDGTVNPQGYAQRAQIATVIMRLVTQVLSK